ncbi:hypothetical protein G6F68_017967 [Rhizopus microsporus]|nr:hypothetical protein G6F68_017967 [Rhizopus microsporus]
MRPKCEAISVNADWRYLTASSGLANCAEALGANNGPTVIQANATSVDNFFIAISRKDNNNAARLARASPGSDPFPGGKGL